LFKEEEEEAGSFLLMLWSCAYFFWYRPVMIEKKLPDLIRKAKLAHHICYDVGAAALRDMGFDDYL
jgi:hypothetical protein